MDLKYFMPTRIVSGKSCVASSAADFAALGKKALIVCGAASAKASGALDDVLAVLSANGQGHQIFDKVPANPGVDCVYLGAEVANKAGCDFVVAIGGGSPMDAAKVIALLAKNRLPQEDLFAGKYGTEILPVVAIPTTAGTGSEVTQYAIITNDAAETKTGIGTPLFFPKIAFLDARYLESVSKRTMTNTVIDSLSHSIEGIISCRASPVTDTLAARGIALVGECIPALRDGTLRPEQLENLMLASTLGGIVIANTGTTSLHAMGYSLTYWHGIEHGRANGLLLAPVLQFIQKSRPDLVRKILEPLGMTSVTALKFVMENLLGEKEKFTREDLAKFAAKAITSKNIGNCAVKPTEADLLDVFQAVFLPGSASPGLAGARHTVIEFIRLEDYFPARHVRIIPSRLRSVPRGVTEIPIEFEFTARTAETLKIPVTWDLKAYGYVHDNDSLKRVFSGEMANGHGDRHVFLNDWGDAFLVTFENGTRDRETTYFVATAEVRALFGSCSVISDNDEAYGGV